MNKFDEKFLDLAIAHNMFSCKKNLQFFLNYIWGKNVLKNKKVLDIGGGRGLLSFSAASCGANVTCLEPELDGSSNQMKDKFNDFHSSFENVFGSVQFSSVTFQDFAKDDDYDLVVMANSINHLDETATISLLKSQESRNIYLDLFVKMNNLLNKNGSLIITDCSCYNIFNIFNLRNPFTPTIEWFKHQTPYTWLSLLESSGFKFNSLQWTTPNRLGKLGSILFSNLFFSYLTTSHFRLEVSKL